MDTCSIVVLVRHCRLAVRLGLRQELVRRQHVLASRLCMQARNEHARRRRENEENETKLTKDERCEKGGNRTCADPREKQVEILVLDVIVDLVNAGKPENTRAHA
jgi:hypothetical protein